MQGIVREAGSAELVQYLQSALQTFANAEEVAERGYLPCHSVAEVRGLEFVRVRLLLRWIRPPMAQASLRRHAAWNLACLCARAAARSDARAVIAPAAALSAAQCIRNARSDHFVRACASVSVHVGVWLWPVWAE